MAIAAPALSYTPQPTQWRWHECPAYESGYGGAKAGGKSLALLMEAVRYIDNPNYRAVLFRRTYPRLQELIERAYAWFPGLGGSWNGQERIWRFKSGATIKMGHVQNEEDKRIYHGHEMGFIGFDQLEEFTESQYLFLMAQNRSSDPTIPTCVRSTFNPGGIGHAWVKQRFLDHGTRECSPWTPYNDHEEALRPRCFHFSTIYDNQALLNADPHYIQTLQALPENERRALLEGDWDVFAGQYFQEWRRDKHVIRPIALDQAWPRWRCVDFGVARPFVCLWLCQDPGTLRVYVYRELSRRNVTPASHQALLISDNSPETEHYRFTMGDPAMWIRANDSGRPLSDIYADEGVQMIPASNDRINGWQVVHEFLRDDAEGVPMLQVFDTCTELIRNLPALVHDEHKVEDVNTDGPDDEADALRYGLMAAQRVQSGLISASPVSVQGRRVNLPQRRQEGQWWAA
jgi:hypothetical protein